MTILIDDLETDMSHRHPGRAGPMWYPLGFLRHRCRRFGEAVSGRECAPDLGRVRTPELLWARRPSDAQAQILKLSTRVDVGVLQEVVYDGG